MVKYVISKIQRFSFTLSKLTEQYSREILGIQCRICKKRVPYHSTEWVYRRWSSGDAGSSFIKNDIPVCKSCFTAVQEDFYRPSRKLPLKVVRSYSSNLREVKKCKQSPNLF